MSAGSWKVSDLPPPVGNIASSDFPFTAAWNGTKVRLKGKGFPVYKKEGQFGDLIVTYSVKIPTNLTDKQKELFRQLQSMN